MTIYLVFSDIQHVILNWPGKSGERQLMIQAAFHGKRKQTDAGVSVRSGPAGADERPHVAAWRYQ